MTLAALTIIVLSGVTIQYDGEPPECEKIGTTVWQTAETVTGARLKLAEKTKANGGDTAYVKPRWLQEDKHGRAVRIKGRMLRCHD